MSCPQPKFVPPFDPRLQTPAQGTILVMGLWLASGAAWSQSASNGQLLYNQVFASGTNSCAASSCHGSTPSRNVNNIASGNRAQKTKTAVSGVGEMRFLSAHLSDADYNDLAAYIASATGSAPSYLAVTPAPAVTLSLGTLTFGAVTLGQTSSSQSVTLTNSGSAALSIASIVTTLASFSVSHNCPATLAVGSSCSLSVSFAPAAAGAVSAQVRVTSNATGSPHAVAVSGSGVSSAVGSLSWTAGGGALQFTATVGQPSAAQALTLQNLGSASATLSTVSLVGSQGDQFVTGGSCGSGVVLDAGANCTVSVHFDPSSSGSKSATLQVAATNAGNPAAVSLTGTATAAAGSSGSSGGNANVGAGGCTLSGSRSVFDPLLLALGAFSAAVLGWRRWRERPLRRPA